MRPTSYQSLDYLLHGSTGNIAPSGTARGFTLVELMIALVLGLLISAAALQIFYGSSVNSRRQEASSQIQDNAIFGLSQMRKHIRRANFGAKSAASYNEFFMNHATPQGGVVLTAPDGSISGPGKWLAGNLSGLVLNGSAVPADLLTTSESSSSGSALSITNSDQLTIQYQAGMAGLFDCEGFAIPENYYVIERYFVREAGLACASAIYEYDEALAGSDTGIDIASYIDPTDGSTNTNNLAGNGTVIIPNVDYFRVLLGVSDAADYAANPEDATLAYMPIPSSSVLEDDERIVSLQMGVLSRSDNPTATDRANTDLSFDILDRTDVALGADAISDNTFLRSVYESTILLRNARGGL